MSTWRKVGLGAGFVSLVPVLGISGYTGYALVTAPTRFSFPDTPYPAIQASADPEIVERGRYLVHGPAHCVSCHTTDDREHPEKVGTTPLHGGLAFDMGPIAQFYAANLTSDPETGLGRRTDAEIARAIETGVLHDGQLSIMMRFSAAELADEDVTAVVSYLRTLPAERREVPPGSIGLLGKLMSPMMPFAPRDVHVDYVPPGPEPTLERGAYLAEHVAACIGCHSPYDESTFQLAGPKFSGGMVEASHGADSDMEYAPPNLTSDPTGITGKLGEDEFVARLRGGRRYPTSIMPWEPFEEISDSDLRSIYRYIGSLPPVAHDTGPSYRKVGWTPG